MLRLFVLIPKITYGNRSANGEVAGMLDIVQGSGSRSP